MCFAVDILFATHTCALFETHSQSLGLIRKSVDGHHLEFDWKAFSEMQWAGDNCWQAVMKDAGADALELGVEDALLSVILANQAFDGVVEVHACPLILPLSTHDTHTCFSTHAHRRRLWSRWTTQRRWPSRNPQGRRQTRKHVTKPQRSLKT